MWSYVRERGGNKLIRRILIANNGMAATKTIMSIRSWAYKTFGDEHAVQFVAMASPEDIAANSEFIRRADEFVQIPSGSSANNYANLQLIVDLCLSQNVDAIMVGWGHASDNPKLGDLLQERMNAAGREITFIGPTSPVMRVLGDKIGSNLLAQSADVSTMPWNGDGLTANLDENGNISAEQFDAACIHSEDEAVEAAERIGYPVMLKASEGRGGKGLRKALDEAELRAAYPQVLGEVPGSPVCLVKLCVAARQLEVQVVGDMHGNVIALGGRDCSTQCRFQKIFEESPPIIAPDDKFEEMMRAAVRLCKKIGYCSAGTVEYLYIPETKDYYFVELKPRLQVEHPVTEGITGVSLPATQLHVAMGIPLNNIPEVRTFYGEDAKAIGDINLDYFKPSSEYRKHVIAARITAENPDDGFKPTSGKIESINFQSDTQVWGYFSVVAGGAVDKFADSQFGHLFATADTREEARKALVLALKELFIMGEIRTTVEYLGELLEMDAFKENTIDTAWLDGLIASKPVGVAVINAGVHRGYKQEVRDVKQVQEAVHGNFKESLEKGQLSTLPLGKLQGPTSARASVEHWLARFEPALHAGNSAETALLFSERGFWRDMVSFTWSIVTFEGREQIANAVASTSSVTSPRNWRIVGDVEWNGFSVRCWLSFETSAGIGRAHICLDSKGRAYTLLTTLSELRGHPPATGRNRPLGTQHGIVAGRKYWHEQRKEALESKDPYVLIIGGGQNGLALGAHLEVLGVPYLIIEAGEAPGHSWRSRYPSLCLHDPVWRDHFPYIPFPESWPVFTPRNKMADWMEGYAKAMDLRVWNSSRVKHARQRKGGGWEIEVERQGEREEQERVILQSQHLVFATGLSGYPQQPSFEGAESFEGLQFHSTAYPGAGDGRFRGKRVVVIGSNVSAHNICQDLWEHGAGEVTMVQRSPSYVVSTSTYLKHFYGPFYSEDAIARGVTHEHADQLLDVTPMRLQDTQWKRGTKVMREQDAQLHERLERVGFKLDFGPDGTGQYGKYAREAGGYYIDVGCSELIADGKVALRSDVRVARLERDAVVLSALGGGEEERLAADVLVCATGFSSMTKFVADIIGDAAASKVGTVWGYGSGTRRDPGPWEGELRNMWKPTAVDGLWFQAGNFAESRHYSRFLALQLQARWFGLPTPVYDTCPRAMPDDEFDMEMV